LVDEPGKDGGNLGNLKEIYGNSRTMPQHNHGNLWESKGHISGIENGNLGDLGHP